jgi:D-alanyl-lipoteichoic acid acyltransferase DltB (MBOAT superfamily)
VAGPIERAVHMLPQFASAKRFEYNFAVSGLRMMLYGLFKKMVIADSMAVFSNQFFDSSLSFDSASAWIALVAFTFQIYCDFSGYSDIAIGTARLLGFEVMVNFKTPYFSRTFSEFWQRWHISLSTWFRDYVFIPLGVNRGSIGKYILNILITFLLSGFWHGAKYTFLIWGGLHGVLLAIEKIIQKKLPSFRWFPFFVFLVVMLCWVPFRAINVDEMEHVYYMLFSYHPKLENFIFKTNIHNISFLILFFLFILFERWLNKTTFHEKIANIPKFLRWMLYYLMITCIFLYGDFNNAPSFIYFQF